MIADNMERNLAVCQDIIDGRWSDWSDSGECKGSQKIEGVEGFRGGEGKVSSWIVNLSPLHCNVFITKFTNFERYTALGLWEGNSARLMDGL